MASPSTSVVNANVPFLKLPGEIFNTICRLAVANQPKVALGANPSAPALVFACSKTYHAVSSIFWGENAFYLRECLHSPVAIRRFEECAGVFAVNVNKVQVMAMWNVPPPFYSHSRRGYLTFTFAKRKNGTIMIERQMRGLPKRVTMCYCKLDQLASMSNKSCPTRGLFRCLQAHAELLAQSGLSCKDDQSVDTCSACGKMELARGR